MQSQSRLEIVRAKQPSACSWPVFQLGARWLSTGVPGTEVSIGFAVNDTIELRHTLRRRIHLAIMFGEIVRG